MATELAAAGFEGLDAADNEAIFKSDAFRMQHMKVRGRGRSRGARECSRPPWQLLGRLLRPPLAPTTL